MDFKQMQQTMYNVFNECDALREVGQKEYAGDSTDSFANFNRLENSLKINRKSVLLVYAMKHWDGICNFVAGHISQREDVRGRINDMIVYLCLLRGMIDEEQGLVAPLVNVSTSPAPAPMPQQGAGVQPLTDGRD